MPFLLIVALAFAPGVFWLWFFARRDVYRPEPRRLLASTFGLGMVATVPAVVVEWLLIDESVATGGAPVASIAIAMLLVVGPVEEVAKFAVVRLAPFRSLYFDEPIDGLVYSAAASLGFASVENLGYIIAFGPGVMILRAPLSTLAHVVFGSIWGYALGLQSQPSAGGSLLVIGGLAAAATVHAVFNVTVFTMPVVSLVILGVGASWTLSRFKWAQRVSPFRYARNYPQVVCSVCDGHIRVTSRYCRFCGSRVAAGHQALFCGNCSARNRPDASYCTACSDQLLS